jgi:NAD(P)-dependent dehydrogenase (short-subunit alcohol dehydrogenase family)
VSRVAGRFRRTPRPVVQVAERPESSATWRSYQIVDNLRSALRGPYAASQHALVGLMRTAAKEVAGRGIRVNSIHPGPVDNAFQHRIEISGTSTAAG